MLEESCLLRHYPAASSIIVTVERGTEDDLAITEFLSVEADVTVLTLVDLRATEDDFSKYSYFCLKSCLHIELDSLEYANEGKYQCTACGRGFRRLRTKLRLGNGSLRGSHVVRIPPDVVVISSKVRHLHEIEGWTGADLRELLSSETSTGGDFVQLEVGNVLPPMALAARIERSQIPKFCEECRRLGYRLADRIPRYPEESIEYFCDWNFSVEWLSENFVSLPLLICSRRVANSVRKLENGLNWIPVVFC